MARASPTRPANAIDNGVKGCHALFPTSIVPDTHTAPGQENIAAKAGPTSKDTPRKFSTTDIETVKLYTIGGLKWNAHAHAHAQTLPHMDRPRRPPLETITVPNKHKQNGMVCFQAPRFSHQILLYSTTNATQPTDAPSSNHTSSYTRVSTHDQYCWKGVLMAYGDAYKCTKYCS